MPGAPVVAHHEGAFVADPCNAVSTEGEGGGKPKKPCFDRSLAKSSLSVGETIQDSPDRDDLDLQDAQSVHYGMSHLAASEAGDRDLPSPAPSAPAASGSEPATKKEVRDSVYFRNLGLILHSCSM